MSMRVWCATLGMLCATWAVVESYPIPSDVQPLEASTPYGLGQSMGAPQDNQQLWHDVVQHANIAAPPPSQWSQVVGSLPQAKVEAATAARDPNAQMASLPQHKPVSTLYDTAGPGADSTGKVPVDAKAATQKLQVMEQAKLNAVESAEKRDERKNEDLQAKVASLKLIDREHADMRKVGINAKETRYENDAQKVIKDRKMLVHDKEAVMAAKVKVGVPRVPT